MTQPSNSERVVTYLRKKEGVSSASLLLKELTQGGNSRLQTENTAVATVHRKGGVLTCLCL